MIIRNLTSELKELEIRELVGTSRVYKIYIEPYGKTDLERVVVLHQEKLTGVEIEGVSTPPVCEVTPVIESPQEPDKTPVEDTEVGEKEETTNEEQTPKSESFICEECGAEFSSARSLSAHKSRSHTKE